MSKITPERKTILLKTIYKSLFRLQLSIHSAAVSWRPMYVEAIAVVV